MAEKITIDVKAIAGANNAMDFKNYSKGKEILTHNINIDQADVVAVNAESDEAKSFIQEQLKTFTTKTNETKSQLQLKLADDVKVFVGREEVELSANIQDDEHQARLIGVFGKDKTFNNNYIRITAIIIKAKSVSEINTAGVSLDESDFNF